MATTTEIVMSSFNYYHSTGNIRCLETTLMGISDLSVNVLDNKTVYEFAEQLSLAQYTKDGAPIYGKVKNHFINCVKNISNSDTYEDEFKRVA